MIFKRVESQRPYPTTTELTSQDWAKIAPCQVPVSELVITKNVLDLERFLSEDSTFYGDLFAHVIKWKGELYLEDGLHRTLRSVLQQRNVIHARILTLDDDGTPIIPGE